MCRIQPSDNEILSLDATDFFLVSHRNTNDGINNIVALCLTQKMGGHFPYAGRTYVRLVPSYVLYLSTTRKQPPIRLAVFPILEIDLNAT